MLVPSIISSLNQLVRLLEEIDSEYVTPCTLLSKSLLRHTRHIVEMFQCLIIAMILVS
jgi:hypothetical protein